MTSDPADPAARLTAVEARVEVAVSDAAAARHLAAARDRDLADLEVKVDANTRLINALGVQTAARFERVEQRLDRVEQRLGGVEQRLGGVEQRLGGVEQRLGGLEHAVGVGFAEMRAKFDRTAAGMQQIVDLLTRRDGG